MLRVANNDTNAEISDSPWALARPSSKGNTKSDIRRSVNSKYRIDELNEPPPRLPGIRALLPLPGGDLLTGGTDLKIRRWDHARYILLLFMHLDSHCFNLIDPKIPIFQPRSKLLCMWTIYKGSWK